MDIIDKIGITVAEVGKEVSKKAKEVTDMAELNLQYKRESEDLEKLYAVLGKKFFRENSEKTAEEIGEDYVSSINIIKIQRQKVSETKDEIIKKKGSKKCTKCSREVANESAYCPHCGERIE